MSCIHSLDRTGIEDTFELSIRARQPSKGEFRWKDGSWCFYELTPYYKEDEIFEGYLGSTTDVTERKESEQKQLEAAEARARDAEESKRQQEAFIDMV
jgi:PAS domain S-box-containing protein